MGGPEADPLLEALAAGREDAFAALYDQFGPPLLRVAQALLGSQADAEDAVQEVFVGLVRARKGLVYVKDLRGYLFASLRRAAARLAICRRRRATVPLEAAAAALVEQAKSIDADRAARLEQSMAALPDEQREVIAFKVDGGLTFADIAELLKISPHTAASRYRYALEKLRLALREEKDERR
jgi:RNA polymerase sigma-70 factor (ECF subfamily)